MMSINKSQIQLKKKNFVTKLGLPAQASLVPATQLEVGGLRKCEASLDSLARTCLEFSLIQFHRSVSVYRVHIWVSELLKNSSKEQASSFPNKTSYSVSVVP